MYWCTSIRHVATSDLFDYEFDSQVYCIVTLLFLCHLIAPWISHMFPILMCSRSRLVRCIATLLTVWWRGLTRDTNSPTASPYNILKMDRTSPISLSQRPVQRLYGQYQWQMGRVPLLTLTGRTRLAGAPVRVFLLFFAVLLWYLHCTLCLWPSFLWICCSCWFLLCAKSTTMQSCAWLIWW